MSCETGILSSTASRPTYALLPFWADLYIYEGTPQGIYYEVAGDAPNRTLTVEWYVSRYQNRDQYYHFSMKVEEARPVSCPLHALTDADRAECGDV